MVFEYVIYEWDGPNGWCKGKTGQVYLMPVPTEEDQKVEIDGRMYEVWNIIGSDSDALPIIELTPVIESEVG